MLNSSAKILAKYISSWFPSVHYEHGLNYTNETYIKTWLDELNKIGYGATVHVTDDCHCAARGSMNAIEDAGAKRSQQNFILTRVEMLDDADVPRFKALNVTADFQVGEIE